MARHPWKTYLSHAFKNVYNVGALILAGGLGLIFMDSFGPGVLLLGAGLELGYLYMMSTNPRTKVWRAVLPRRASPMALMSSVSTP